MLDKPQVNIFVICDRVIRDQNGKPSLLGVFDTLTFPVFPAVFPFVLFTQIVAPKGEYQFSIHLSETESAPKKLFEEAIKVADDPGRAYVETNLSLLFDHPGLFEFRLYINAEPKLTCPFRVYQVVQVAPHA